MYHVAMHYHPAYDVTRRPQIPKTMPSNCNYRTDSNVGRIVNRVATFRNIANDLLRTLMIKNLIEYF